MPVYDYNKGDYVEYRQGNTRYLGTVLQPSIGSRSTRFQIAKIYPNNTPNAYNIGDTILVLPFLKPRLTKILTARNIERIGKKAINQSLRNIYEDRTGQSSNVGTGPLNTIRAFANVQPPKGSRTQRRQRKTRKGKY